MNADDLARLEGAALLYHVQDPEQGAQSGVGLEHLTGTVHTRVAAKDALDAARLLVETTAEYLLPLTPQEERAGPGSRHVPLTPFRARELRPALPRRPAQTRPRPPAGPSSARTGEEEPMRHEHTTTPARRPDA